MLSPLIESGILRYTVGWSNYNVHTRKNFDSSIFIRRTSIFCLFLLESLTLRHTSPRPCLQLLSSFNMARLLQLLALYAIFTIAMVSAAPMLHASKLLKVAKKIAPHANQIRKAHTDAQTQVSRKGNKKDVVGGAIREQDWNKKDGLVHPDPNKGLSVTRHTLEPTEDGVIHSIKSSEVNGDFTIKHDGSDVQPGSVHPDGHSTIAYTGQDPVDPKVLKAKLNALPWTKHKTPSPDPSKDSPTTKHESEAKTGEVIPSTESSKATGDSTIKHDGSDVQPSSVHPDGHLTIAKTGQKPVTPEKSKPKTKTLGQEKHKKR